MTLPKIRPHVHDEIKSVECISVCFCAFNTFLPQYSRVDDYHFGYTFVCFMHSSQLNDRIITHIISWPRMAINTIICI